MSKEEKYRNVIVLGILILFIGMSVNPLSVALQDFTQVTEINGNSPPSTPIFLGPTEGFVGEEYSYTINSTDSDGDDIYYQIQWKPSGGIWIWFGPHESGEEVTVVYTWDKRGTYPVLARAMDVHNEQSEFAILEVVIGETIYVDDDNTAGPWNGTQEYPYQYIQDGVDAANPGDTVFVYNGTYYENVIIDTSINLIGENRTTTIIDANVISTVITIHAENVTVIGFTILNGEYGIWSENSKNNIIRNNKICFNTQDGIKLECSSHNHIIKNTIHSNEGSGIRAYSSNNTIINNSIYSNHETGIAFLGGTDDNSISNNTIFLNHQEGISLQLGSRNIIINNIITMNMDNGIYVGYHSDNNIIKGNNISQNEQIGIEIFQARKNCITNNNIVNNIDGLYIWNNTQTSDDNSIYHNNFINNTQNAYDECDNTWDNGYPSGGNYWDDYTGTDSDGDGIGDTPYDIYGSGEGQDLYPLMNPWGENLPVANFTYSADNLSVTFDASSSYDRDGEILSYIWDFGDGAAIMSVFPNCTHTYSEPGTYEVTLTVLDDDGYEGQITKQIEIENGGYEFETVLLIGRITNLNAEGDAFTFNSVMVRYITFFPFSFNSYYSGETIAISQDYIGLVGARFIIALCSASFGMSPPTILFSQADQSATNTLTVISADPADMVWSDFDLQVDGIASAHGMSGTVTAGDIIDITAIAGTGAYTISLRHIPTNTLIGSWDFEAGI